MTAFVSDTFSGTAATELDGRNADSPASPWSRFKGSAGVVLDGSGAIYGPADSADRAYAAPGTPGSADYEVRGTLIHDGTGGPTVFAVIGRTNTGATQLECYSADHVTSSNTWVLYLRKEDAGGAGVHYLQLGTYAQDLTDNQAYQVVLRMVGNQISLYVDGVLRIGPITNSAISAAGVAGILHFSSSGTTAFKMQAFEAEDVSSIACTDQTSGRVFQRTKGTTAKTITFAGTYTGTAPTTVEVKIVEHGTTNLVQDWTAISGATISGGSWSGSLSVPQGDGSVWYNFLARGKDGGGSVIATSSQTSNKWGVGILIATIGQSNMTNMFDVSSTPPASHDLTRKYDGSWGVVTGNGAIELCNRVRAGADLPIGILDYAIGSTGLHSDPNLAGYWIDTAGGSPWALFDTGVTAVGGDYEFLLWHQGETDADAGTTKTQYKSDLDTLYTRARTQTGRNTSQLKFGVATIATWSAGGISSDPWDVIRQAQLEWASETTGGFFLGSTVDATLDGGGAHYTAASYLRIGKRYAQAVLFQLGEVAFGADGPIITSATRVLGQREIRVAITQDSGTDLTELDGSTDGAGVTGFQVSDDDFATTLTIASTVFVFGAVILELDAAPADGDTIKVRYQNGILPTITNPVYDDTVPQSDTVGLPLQPSRGSVTATATSSGGSSLVGGNLIQ